MSQFQKFLETHPTQQLLPLVHTMPGHTFNNLVLGSKKLEASECSVFNENLIYFFYGRPSYRIDPEIGSVTSDANLPVCFVLRPTLPIVPTRIFPFDSGAFKSDLYRRYIYKTTQIEEFLVGNSLSDASKVISAFFDTNRNYYMGTVKQIPKIPFDYLTASYYYDLISSRGQMEFDTKSNKMGTDDRKYTIEVQFSQAPEIDENIIAIILPEGVLESQTIRQLILNEWECEPITYPSFNGHTPNEYHTLILFLLMNFLKTEGYIK